MARVSFDFVAADLETLRAVPSNAALLASGECADGNGGRAGASPWVVGGYVVTTHPDLVAWTAQVADAVAAAFVFVCGGPALVAEDGRVLGWGRGTHDFVIRATPRAAEEILAHGGHVDERSGPDWLVFPAFLPKVPADDRIPTAARWLMAARDA
jgi:hypothetical protein